MVDTVTQSVVVLVSVSKLLKLDTHLISYGVTNVGQERNYLPMHRQYKLVSSGLHLICLKHLAACPVLYEKNSGWALELLQ